MYNLIVFFAELFQEYFFCNSEIILISCENTVCFLSIWTMIAFFSDSTESTSINASSGNPSRVSMNEDSFYTIIGFPKAKAKRRAPL